jgi:RNA ligase (TIGR02306 family)
MPDFDNEFTEKEYIETVNEAHKSERALATIRKIEELKPIEGADLIELAIVDGWQVVVKKGEFAVGDLAVYFEIDSFLPQSPEFEFLRKSSFRKNWDGTEGFRLKTIKLRGQLSQGLLLPTDAFNINTIFFAKGDDLTEVLGVSKWEKPVSPQLAGVARGNFPSFIPKTDENRIQNLGRDREKFRAARQWYVREKLDGSSMTVYLNEGQFGVCSRNYDLEETEDNGFWQMARKLDLEAKLRRVSTIYGMAIQGELVGPGINGNRYNLTSPWFYVFGIWDIEQRFYVNDRAMALISADLGLCVAPLYMIVGELPESTSDILLMSDRKSMINHHVDAEGCVWRHYDLDGLKYSFKAISNKFLLGEKD